MLNPLPDIHLHAIIAPATLGSSSGCVHSRRCISASATGCRRHSDTVEMATEIPFSFHSSRCQFWILSLASHHQSVTSNPNHDGSDRDQRRRCASAKSKESHQHRPTDLQPCSPNASPRTGSKQNRHELYVMPTKPIETATLSRAERQLNIALAQPSAKPSRS